MSPVLKDLLFTIRQHDGFKELLGHVKRPQITTFRISDAEKPETARSRFIYQSGQVAQHETWLAFLTGDSTSQQEI